MRKSWFGGPALAGDSQVLCQTPTASEKGMQWSEGTEWVGGCAHLVAGGFPWLQLLQAEAKEGEDDAGEEDHKGEEGDRHG